MNSQNVLYQALARLPELLVRLLQQRDGISLERLQLVSLSILACEEALSDTVELRYYQENNDNFLLLEEYFQYDNKIYLIKIVYFMRSKKKVFVPKILLTKEFKLVQEFRISKNENQDNSIFYDQELNLLNGKKNIPVYMGFIISKLLAFMPKNYILSACVYNFYHEIIIDEPLTLYSSSEENNYELQLIQDNKLCLSLLLDS